VRPLLSKNRTYLNFTKVASRSADATGVMGGSDVVSNLKEKKNLFLFLDLLSAAAKIQMCKPRQG
jgi:hypothetical protein